MKFNILTFLTTFLILTILIVGAFFGFVEIGPNVIDNDKSVLAATTEKLSPIGKSADGTNIDVWKIGNGAIPVLIVGGMNGKPEGEGIAVVETARQGFEEGITYKVPEGVTVYFIPQLTYSAKGLGFNFNNKDVNRNFDSKTVPGGEWTPLGCSINRYAAYPGHFDTTSCADKTKFTVITADGPVSKTTAEWFPAFCKNMAKSQTAQFTCAPNAPGEKPYSEPETKAIIDFIKDKNIKYVLSYRANRNEVTTSNAPPGEKLPAADQLANIIASTTGKKYLTYFVDYPVNGQFMDWLQDQNIPGVEVEIPTVEPQEITSNLNAIQKALECIASGNCASGTDITNTSTDVCTGLKSVNPGAFFCQSDPKWGGTNAPRSGSDQGCNLAHAGCGPTTAAMILARTGYAKFPTQNDWGGLNLSNLDGLDAKGQEVNPLTVDHLFAAGGWRPARPNYCGSDFYGFTTWLTKIGYTVKPVGINMKEIADAIQEGYTLAVSDNQYGGHLYGISGVDLSSNTLTVFDPAQCTTGGDVKVDYTTFSGQGVKAIWGVKNNGS